jgi:large subunit ribosomal protein L21
MYTVVELGGHQLCIEPGYFYSTKFLVQKQLGETLCLKRALASRGYETIKLGVPFIEHANVQVTVLKHFKDKKISVFKMKSKKKYRNLLGYREKKTLIQCNQAT